MLNSIDDILEQYSDLESQIAFVTDFNIEENPYNFKVVFEVIKRDGSILNPVAWVAPELLHKRYKIGSKFKGERQIGYADYISIESFEIDTRERLQRCHLYDVIDENDIKIISYDSVYRTVLKQNCYYIKYDEYDVIIPHYTIANHFHFQSSSLKHAILEDTFDSLCYKNTFIRYDDNKVGLRIKSKANQSDLKTICYFLENKNAFNSFKYYVHQKARVSSGGKSYKIGAVFPFEGVFNIKTICRQINTEGKMKLLVLGIYQDDFQYPFKEIFYKMDKSNDLNSITLTNSTIQRQKPKKRSGKIVNRVPSSVYIIDKQFFIEKEFNEINDVRLYPEFIGSPTGTFLSIELAEKKVDGSFVKAKPNGDKNAQEETLANGKSARKKEKPPFNINKFDILFNKLIEHEDIKKASLSHNMLLKPRYNEKRKIPPKYFICADIPRSYKHGMFMLANNEINLIEIEAGGSWRKTSTWFFIFTKSFNEKDINDIVFLYIGEENTLEKVALKLLNDKKIKFFRKNHPKSLEEKDIFDWSKRTLELLIEHINS